MVLSGGAFAPADACREGMLRSLRLTVDPGPGASIDSLEVSHCQYKRCVDEDQCPVPTVDPDDPVTFRWDDFRRRRRPIGHLSFEEMSAYCKNAAPGRGRLPTWAELRLAVQGTMVEPRPTSLFARALSCWGSHSSGSAACLRLDGQWSGSPTFRLPEGGGTAIWDDADGFAPFSAPDDHLGENWLIANAFGGIPERTSTHVDSVAYCAAADGAPDWPPDPSAASHVVFSPADDLHRGLSGGGIITPVERARAYRSWKLGFRCVRFR